MKLVFQKNNDGIALGFVECLSTEEADQFLNWFALKMSPSVAPAETTTTPEPEVDAPVAVEAEVKVTRNDVSQAAISLVQTKGRKGLDPILGKFGAIRISAIQDSDLPIAFSDIQKAAK